MSVETIRHNRSETATRRKTAFSLFNVQKTEKITVRGAFTTLKRLVPSFIHHFYAGPFKLKPFRGHEPLFDDHIFVILKKK